MLYVEVSRIALSEVELDIVRQLDISREPSQPFKLLLELSCAIQRASDSWLISFWSENCSNSTWATSSSFSNTSSSGIGSPGSHIPCDGKSSLAIISYITVGYDFGSLRSIGAGIAGFSRFVSKLSSKIFKSSSVNTSPARVCHSFCAITMSRNISFH